MTTFEDRLRSFDNGWCVEFLRPDEMAKAGFIYFGIQDLVKCVFCSKDFDSWQEGDIPLAEHMFHSPHCSFVCEAKKNVQLIKSEDRFRTFDNRWCLQFLCPRVMVKAGFIYSGIQDRVKCLSCLKDFDNWQQGDDPLRVHLLQSPQCPFVCTPSSNKIQITTISSRLRTFDDGWCVKFLNPLHMAKAGFIYLGIQDCVKCLSCLNEFDNWQQGDDPLLKHLNQSPRCPFVNEPTVGFDVCGLYGSDPTDTYVKAKKVQEGLDSVGIIQQLNPIRYTEYDTIDARLKSFDKCLIILKQDINVLSEAGFFYGGNGTNDKMLCFYCGVFLHNWEDNDEPWTEHAKFSKTCAYLLLNKGKMFVDKALGVGSDIIQSNLMGLVKLIAGQEDTFILGTTMKIKSSKKVLDSLQNTDISKINVSSDKNQHLTQTRDPNTMPYFMLCKICFKEEINVAFVPCGHAVTCIHCALTIKQCPLCRYPFNKAMRVYLSMNKDLELVPNGSSKCSDKLEKRWACKICNDEDNVAAFIPCRHVCACIKCAEEIHECPVCTENVCSFIQIYI